MANGFDLLPVEVLLMILSELPLPSLIAFGATSRRNFACHVLCMRRLHLGVFQKRIHATLAFLGKNSKAHCAPVILQPRYTRNNNKETESNDSPPSTPTTRSPSPPTTPTKRGHERLPPMSPGRDLLPCPPLKSTIHAQNDVLARVLRRYGRSLIDLRFMAYDLAVHGANALVNFCGPKLQHLALCFEHPYVRTDTLTHTYWLRPAPTSAAWSALIRAGIPGKSMGGLCNLRSLTLERAGISAWQLRILVRQNRSLKVLKLRTCGAVQPSFVNWLGGLDRAMDERGEKRFDDIDTVPGRNLEVLWLENCDGISTLDPRDVTMSEDGMLDIGLNWVKNLKSLRVGCVCSPEYLDSAADQCSLFPFISAVISTPHWSPERMKRSGASHI